MPPQHALNQTEVALFKEDEALYRRYPASHFHDGVLDPSAIRFHEPPSFLRSAFSVPEDALHPDCADGNSTSQFGVLTMLASAANHQQEANDGSKFNFSPVHRPLPSCYAHSEVHCVRASDPNREHVEPPKHVKNAFRLRIARALSIAIPAPLK